MSIARRGRSLCVTGFILAGSIGIISSTQTWLTVTRVEAGEQILVPGADALALLAPLSLAVLAVGAALALVGRALRYVFAVLALVAGALLAWWTAAVLFATPISAVTRTVTETTGLAGTSTISEMIKSIEPSVWPVLALIGGVLLILSALVVLATAHLWKTGGRRYRTQTAPHVPQDGPIDAIDSWDELSHGTDPTR